MNAFPAFPKCRQKERLTETRNRTPASSYTETTQTVPQPPLRPRELEKKPPKPLHFCQALESLELCQAAALCASRLGSWPQLGARLLALERQVALKAVKVLVEEGWKFEEMKEMTEVRKLWEVGVLENVLVCWVGWAEWGVCFFGWFGLVWGLLFLCFVYCFVEQGLLLERRTL